MTDKELFKQAYDALDKITAMFAAVNGHCVEGGDDIAAFAIQAMMRLSERLEQPEHVLLQDDGTTLIIDKVINIYQLRRTEPSSCSGLIECSKSYTKLLRTMRKLQSQPLCGYFDIVEAKAYRINGKLYCERDPDYLNGSPDDLRADELFEKCQKAGLGIFDLDFLHSNINGKNK